MNVKDKNNWRFRNEPLKVKNLTIDRQSALLRLKKQPFVTKL